jgi:hypothetical protein
VTWAMLTAFSCFSTFIWGLLPGRYCYTVNVWVWYTLRWLVCVNANSHWPGFIIMMPNVCRDYKEATIIPTYWHWMQYAQLNMIQHFSEHILIRKFLTKYYRMIWLRRPVWLKSIFIYIWCLHIFRSINDHLQKANSNTWGNYDYIIHSISSSKFCEVLHIKILN